eukprot:TRINITY_DN120829_c0_g1_i1.p1 TRINITY_DN120829_c0_g1~~TRINITY_DN120829_c0_g1_i1.p1  ORF type:complete len:456 (-),score=85.08 TRINITY_DN120829_c0_g1_i1:196-1563(-)
MAGAAAAITGARHGKTMVRGLRLGSERYKVVSSTDEPVSCFREIFRYAEGNTYEKFKCALLTVGHTTQCRRYQIPHPGKSDLEFMLKVVDTDKDGRVSEREAAFAFRVWLCWKVLLGRIKELYHRLDSDSDGQLNAQELEPYMVVLNDGEDITQAEVMSVMRRADANQDGTLDIPELTFATAVWYADINGYKSTLTGQARTAAKRAWNSAVVRTSSMVNMVNSKWNRMVNRGGRWTVDGSTRPPRESDVSTRDTSRFQSSRNSQTSASGSESEAETQRDDVVRGMKSYASDAWQSRESGHGYEACTDGNSVLHSSPANAAKEDDTYIVKRGFMKRHVQTQKAAPVCESLSKKSLNGHTMREENCTLKPGFDVATSTSLQQPSHQSALPCSSDVPSSSTTAPEGTAGSPSGPPSEVGSEELGHPSAPELLPLNLSDTGVELMCTRQDGSRSDDDPG